VLAEFSFGAEVASPFGVVPLDVEGVLGDDVVLGV